jgi:hypothetical protein
MKEKCDRIKLKKKECFNCDQLFDIETLILYIDSTGKAVFLCKTCYNKIIKN